ncbi:hypothetical protein ElyMa_003915700 [Elysia marginata]|uniref:Secreted protein n=1 Tax=Elysia marginata TaxID=1093978 RepID=A0AAV4FQP0_9GAST|nr:hypothetical protein ElyMa_003915700 [Elysia marginata]
MCTGTRHPALCYVIMTPDWLVLRAGQAVMFVVPVVELVVCVHSPWPWFACDASYSQATGDAQLAWDHHRAQQALSANTESGT